MWANPLFLIKLPAADAIVHDLPGVTRDQCPLANGVAWDALTLIYTVGLPLLREKKVWRH